MLGLLEPSTGSARTLGLAPRDAVAVRPRRRDAPVGRPAARRARRRARRPRARALPAPAAARRDPRAGRPRRPRATAAPRRCRAARPSASGSRSRSPATPTSCSSTSRPSRWTSRAGGRSGTTCAGSPPRAAPSCSRPTTSTRPTRSPTGSSSSTAAGSWPTDRRRRSRPPSPSARSASRCADAGPRTTLRCARCPGVIGARPPRRRRVAAQPATPTRPSAAWSPPASPFRHLEVAGADLDAAFLALTSDGRRATGRPDATDRLKESPMLATRTAAARAAVARPVPRLPPARGPAVAPQPPLPRVHDRVPGHALRPVHGDPAGDGDPARSPACRGTSTSWCRWRPTARSAPR